MGGYITIDEYVDRLISKDKEDDMKDIKRLCGLIVLELRNLNAEMAGIRRELSRIEEEERGRRDV